MSNRYKELRERKQMTQTEIAELLEMHQTAWGRFETGKVADPRVSTIKQICEKCNVSADWLLGLTDEYKPLRKRE